MNKRLILVGIGVLVVATLLFAQQLGTGKFSAVEIGNGTAADRTLTFNIDADDPVIEWDESENQLGMVLTGGNHFFAVEQAEPQFGFRDSDSTTGTPDVFFSGGCDDVTPGSEECRFQIEATGAGDRDIIAQFRSEVGTWPVISLPYDGNTANTAEIGYTGFSGGGAGIVIDETIAVMTRCNGGDNDGDICDESGDCSAGGGTCDAPSPGKDLGTATVGFRDLYLDDDATIGDDLTVNGVLFDTTAGTCPATCGLGDVCLDTNGDGSTGCAGDVCTVAFCTNSNTWYYPIDSTSCGAQAAAFDPDETGQRFVSLIDMSQGAGESTFDDWIAPRSITIDDLYVLVDTDPAADPGWSVSIRDDGANAITCTIGSGATSCSSSTGASVAQGSKLNIRHSNSGGIAPAGEMLVSFCVE